jgi:hypothetical protein
MYFKLNQKEIVNFIEGRLYFWKKLFRRKKYEEKNRWLFSTTSFFNG